MAEVHEATLALLEIRRGDPEAADRLLPLVYDELRRVAASRLGSPRAGQSLAPTDLVHEVFLRLIDQTGVTFSDRAHFFAVAATAMRQILADRARSRNAAKRGGGRARVELLDHDAPCEDRVGDLAGVDEALSRLEGIDARLARVVELRFFGGMTVDEVADVLSISKSTVEADWRTARAFLNRELTRPA